MTPIATCRRALAVALLFAAFGWPVAADKSFLSDTLIRKGQVQNVMEYQPVSAPSCQNTHVGLVFSVCLMLRPLSFRVRLKLHYVTTRLWRVSTPSSLAISPSLSISLSSDISRYAYCPCLSVSVLICQGGSVPRLSILARQWFLP